MIADHVVPRNSDQPDRLVQRFERIQIVEGDVSKGNAECVFLIANQLRNHVVHRVLDFLVVARLRVAKQKDLERLRFVLTVKREVNRLGKSTRWFDSSKFELG